MLQYSLPYLYRSYRHTPTVFSRESAQPGDKDTKSSSATLKSVSTIAGNHALTWKRGRLPVRQLWEFLLRAAEGALAGLTGDAHSLALAISAVCIQCVWMSGREKGELNPNLSQGISCSLGNCSRILFLGGMCF